MQETVQVTFRNMDKSEAIELDVRERAEKLQQFYPRITACRVVIEEPHRRGAHGRIFHVRVDLTVPGGEIVVNRDPAGHRAHEDPYVAVRDAFDAARRQLEDFVRKHRGDVKRHEAPAHHGVVVRLSDEGFGFIRTEDGEAQGEEVYFHRNAVLDGGFDQLKEGDEVRFELHENGGTSGPHASSVVPVGRAR